MRFGEEASPRIYTWGNPGVPSTSANSNSVLGVPRATEGGKFSRNYVPMHDASTTDPVVRQVRWPWREHEQHAFDFLTLVTGTGTAPQAVVAVDVAGRMWTWGSDMSREESGVPHDCTGLGGQAVNGNPGSLMHRPVRVLTPAEREGSASLFWRKVQSKPNGHATVAITSGGKLYGSGLLPADVFLDSVTASSQVSHTAFSAISTQTWTDFAFAAGSFWAIRNDGTLHTKSPTFSPITSSTQVKGMVVDAYLNGFFALQTGTSQSLSYTLSAPPAGGVQAEILVVKNTATGDYRPYVKNAGRNYTATPTVTRLISPAAAVNRSLTLQMSRDTSWKRIDSNGHEALLFCDNGGGAYSVFQLQPRNADMPDAGFCNTHEPTESAEIFHVNRPSRTSTDATLENIVNQTRSGVVHWDPTRKDESTKAGEYVLLMSVSANHTNNSNVVAWGNNQSGCLAVGHTNPQRTVAFVSSPDTVEFSAQSLSLGGDYALAIRTQTTRRLPGSPTAFARHLYCAGNHAFAGNSAATAAITSFTMCSPRSVNINHLVANGSGRLWNRAVFAHSVGQQQFSVASREDIVAGNNDDLT